MSLGHAESLGNVLQDDGAARRACMPLATLLSLNAKYPVYLKVTPSVSRRSITASVSYKASAFCRGTPAVAATGMEVAASSMSKIKDDWAKTATGDRVKNKHVAIRCKGNMMESRSDYEVCRIVRYHRGSFAVLFDHVNRSATASLISVSCAFLHDSCINAPNTEDNTSHPSCY
jgi:hypothetical protein